MPLWSVSIEFSLILPFKASSLFLWPFFCGGTCLLWATVLRYYSLLASSRIWWFHLKFIGLNIGKKVKVLYAQMQLSPFSTCGRALSKQLSDDRIFSELQHLLCFWRSVARSHPMRSRTLISANMRKAYSCQEVTQILCDLPDYYICYYTVCFYWVFCP